MSINKCNSFIEKATTFFGRRKSSAKRCSTVQGMHNRISIQTRTHWWQFLIFSDMHGRRCGRSFFAMRTLRLEIRITYIEGMFNFFIFQWHVCSVRRVWQHAHYVERVSKHLFGHFYRKVNAVNIERTAIKINAKKN